MNVDEQHTHDWLAITDDGVPLMYACATCPETTAACRTATCRRPLDTSRAICDPCHDHARRVLADIRDLLAVLTIDQRQILGLRAIRYDATTGTATRDDSTLPFGLNTVHDALISGPAGIRTPHGAMDLLETWVDDWSDQCDDGADTRDTLTYLSDHTLWAAQNHPAWDDYLSEARQTRAIIRRLAGRAPERVHVPCVCGGQLVRDWTPFGLDDDARCTACGDTWEGDVATTRLLELPYTHPDLLVTLDDARRILPHVKRNTVNQTRKRDRDRHAAYVADLAAWVQRNNLDDPDNPKPERPAERLPLRGHNDHGADLYRLGDLAHLIKEHATA